MQQSDSENDVLGVEELSNMVAEEEPQEEEPQGEDTEEGGGEGEGRKGEREDHSIELPLQPLLSPSSLPPPSFALGTLSPEYLDRVSHAHDWVFGAIAELVDNSIDSGAKKVKITLSDSPNTGYLAITDDGGGMDPHELANMLSFGYTSKVSSHKIGQFGVGFKSGSMRIGSDVLIFTKKNNTYSLAFLSRTFLKGKSRIETPIIAWNEEKKLVSDHDTSSRVLEVLSQYSWVKSSQTIGHNFDTHLGHTHSGTHIVIYGLKHSPAPSHTELRVVRELQKYTWADGQEDIHIHEDLRFHKQNERVEPLPLDYSLKTYLELLYFKSPATQITIGSSPIEIEPLHRRLGLKKRKQYEWKLSRPGKKPLAHTVVCGISASARSQGQCGVFVYHRNRLVKSYMPLGWQLRPDNELAGCLVYLEAHSKALNPTHNKQGFHTDYAYDSLKKGVAELIKKYWMQHDANYGKFSKADKDTVVHWIMCDTCKKWRKLPENGVKSSHLPENWYCYQNTWDPLRNNCVAPEEKSDENYYAKSNYLDTTGGEKRKRVKKKRKSRSKHRTKRRKTTTRGACFYLLFILTKQSHNWQLICELSSTNSPSSLPKKVQIRKTTRTNEYEMRHAPVFCTFTCSNSENEFLRFWDWLTSEKRMAEVDTKEGVLHLVPASDRHKKYFIVHKNLKRKTTYK